ncbi:MAG: zinc metalloprotease HtpX [Alphaproteobacteria bacterium]|jgi:heat shock protein HtpX|nr:zinc metalloprotease HtpX [Alphaproteobacteria bacterium]
MISHLLDDTARRRHKRRNLLHSALLLIGIVGLLSLTSWLALGPVVAVWLLLIWALMAVVSPRISPRVLLRLYRARPLHPTEFPAGYELLQGLARRAGLAAPPRLYYLPSATVNAFTIGGRSDAAIAVTDGLFRVLTLRELAGVLAHEISHIENNDLWVMNLADGISRLTSFLSYFGIISLFFSLPMLFIEGSFAPVLASAVLILAPTVASLLQLALSRAREFDADLDAAGLTGDPVGLARALAKLEQRHAGAWERIFLPGRRVPDPSILRSHPKTEDRVERLLSLRAKERPEGLRPAEVVALPSALRPVEARPRWRRSGLWY